jgi:hypothetical protein
VHDLITSSSPADAPRASISRFSWAEERLEWRRIRHRRVERADDAHRRVERLERLFLDDRGEALADAARSESS